MGFVVGMDIGYGNLKLAFGDSREAGPFTEIYPACAVPAEWVATSMFQSEAENETGIRVQVGGADWMAGVPENAVQLHTPRRLHEQYVGSDPWTALAYAGLLMTGATVIDKLVVGLPVQHFEARRDLLKRLLQKVHPVTSHRQIEVREVVVAPQPVGAYVDAMNGVWCAEASQDRLAEETSLVIDPGFFSVDWTLVRDGGRYAAMASGSSLFAVSKVLEEASNLIAKSSGKKPPTVEQLEGCLQNRKDKLYIFHQEILLAPVFEQAASKIGQEAFSEMQAALRQVKESINFIIMAGGGASLYLPLAQEIYQDSEILISDAPELANARGFWHLGAQSFV